jgi:predicted dehydrogenase
MSKVRVGQIGLGAIGRGHYDCYGKTVEAELVALCDIEQTKLAGVWEKMGFNLGDQPAEQHDLSKYRTYTDWREIIADPEIDMIDVCLPIPMHAEVTVAALKAGKHVLCEKPMARTAAQCVEMVKAAEETGKLLMIGQCLRFWPEYRAAKREIESGKYGKPLYARLHRAGGIPRWSYQDWLRTPSESGGVVLDMHVHDVDAAIWWFGKPDQIQASGLLRDDLPVAVDTLWLYDNGMRVYIHSAWDQNEPPGAWAFSVILEKATLTFDTRRKEKVRVHTVEGTEQVELPTGSAYLDEIEYFAKCIQSGESPSIVPLGESRAAVECVLEEIRQIYSGYGKDIIGPK